MSIPLLLTCDFWKKMAKANKEIIALKCTECNLKNYTTYKTKNIKEKIEKKKFCSNCKKHTLHKETKVK